MTGTNADLLISPLEMVDGGEYRSGTISWDLLHLLLLISDVR